MPPRPLEAQESISLSTLGTASIGSRSDKFCATPFWLTARRSWPWLGQSHTTNIAHVRGEEMLLADPLSSWEPSLACHRLSSDFDRRNRRFCLLAICLCVCILFSMCLFPMNVISVDACFMLVMQYLRLNSCFSDGNSDRYQRVFWALDEIHKPMCILELTLV